MSGRHYLITGGAGFIGSALVRRLISQSDHRVFNVDKLGAKFEFGDLVVERVETPKRFVTFDLSVKTIEAHKFNLMRKLDIHNKAQLVQYAVQKKIIKIAIPA